MTNGFIVPLRRRRDLVELGYDSRRIRREVESGHLRAMRRGVFARTSELAPLTVEDHAVLRARAYSAVAAVPPIFAASTAAAIHGLPLLLDDGKTHVISPNDRPGSGYEIVRHRGQLDDGDVTEIRGLLCTSVPRTIADIARLESHELAVSVADAALRLAAYRSPGVYDVAAAEAVKEAARTSVHPHSMGRAQARRVLEFADGRAQLPGESISRIRLAELGFAAPSLQVPVRGPRGRTYWVDFGLDDVEAWGEFDGKAKYRASHDKSPADIVAEEKRREDWIRGVTKRPVVRWGWADITDAATLGRRLAAFGIRPDPSPT
ncbi:Transcriptional regulator, AbiEi antitoxin, Type IV TA system [Microbacterium sp. RURRCA19A]|nr:Transcriptional regulator, AbiEi antitoxin, Type IV TA system [Microbacterium sp. RURRCA19A]